MTHPFDPGPVKEPFASLAHDYPGANAYPPEMFRVVTSTRTLRPVSCRTRAVVGFDAGDIAVLKD